MARRSKGDVFFGMMRLPGVRSLSADETVTFLALAEWLAENEKPSFILGSEIMNLESILRETRANNLEFDAQMRRFAALNLLVKDADGAICCPALSARNARAEASRNNGLKGGRPPKKADSSATKESPKSRQGALILPLKGALSGKPERALGSAASTTSSYLEKREVSEEEFHAAGEAVLDAAGVVRAKSCCNYGIVRQWLADGADQALLVEVISGIMARPNAPVITHSLNYFIPAVAAAIKNWPAKKPDYEKAFDRALAFWKLNGSVPEERPVLSDFKARLAS